MKAKVCYIKGIVIEHLGDCNGLHQSDDTPIGESVEYPFSDCSIREEDKKVLIDSHDEYGSSAIIIDNIEIIYKEEELPIYTYWKEHFK